MKWTLWPRRTSDFEGGLSLFLAVYVLILVGMLLGIHMLQPEPDDPHDSWQTPAHARSRA